jgi:flagellar hook-associated protein 1 FlgK
MSGLISSLNNSAGAIKVHSKGLEIVGKNLANINNRGYSKQRVEIGDRGSINTGIATESMGVEAMELRQNRDALLDKSVMREITSTSSLEAAKKILESAETALGQFLDRTKDSTSIQNAPGSNGGGISDALSDFFNAWESFSVKPNDVGEKQLLIAKAQILAEKINATDKRLAQVQTDADNQITTDVGVVNDLLAEIAKNNEYIAKAELVKPFSAVDLRDQRQAKLEELAKYIDVSFEPITPDGLGQIIVKSGGNILVNANEVVGQYNYDSDTRDFQFDGTSLNANLPSGKISAQLTAAIDNIQSTRSQIKDLAIQLKQEVNNTYNANGGTGNFFNFSVTSDDLLDFQFNSSMSPTAGTAGGNVRALKVAELGTKIYSPITKAELTSATPHGLLDGDSVTVSVGGTTTNYLVEKLSDTSFMLKSAATPPVYADLTGSLTVTKAGATPLAVPVTGRTLDFSGSFSANFNKTVTILAQELNSTNIRLEDQKLSENMAVANRDQFSGVSQDEEMTDMMKFQRSFQASARHISVIDELLDLVVNRLGRF